MTVQQIIRISGNNTGADLSFSKISALVWAQLFYFRFHLEYICLLGT
jgi:hypothetical protein